MRARALVATTMLALALVAASGVRASRPLVTGILDPAAFGAVTTPSDLALSYSRALGAGASVVRLSISWASVAPKTRPAAWHPTDPNDPAYDWSGPDATIKAAVQHGMTPIVAVNGSPSWASLVDSPISAPRAKDFGDFATAAARRYSGATAGLPHVKYWQAWIEPNLSIFFQPQFQGKKPVSPEIYRDMVNAFAAGVHAASPDNLVIAGGTAPFRDITPGMLAIDEDWGPLTFMRQLLCLSRTLEPTCSTPVHFDVWDHHPYTSGGPSHKAAFPDDVSLGDLGKMRATLQAGVRAHHVVSRGAVRFWVTEFSWDSNPPDPKGVPMALLTRWVAEGLYTMWRSGVSLVVWLQLRDDALSTSYIQSGLYFHGATVGADRPKPILRAFRFPFVAYPKPGAVTVWGRTPAGKAGAVRVDARVASRWRTIGGLTADGNGIFQATLNVRGATAVRASFPAANDVSAPFSLTAPPDQFFNPFGGAQLEPRTKP